jgi:hypothetical protein
MLAPKTQVPGPSAEGGAHSVLRENTLTMVSAFIGSFSEASISAGDTFIGKAVPTSTRWLTRSLQARGGFQRDQRAPAVADQRRRCTPARRRAAR